MSYALIYMRRAVWSSTVRLAWRGMVGSSVAPFHRLAGPRQSLDSAFSRHLHGLEKDDVIQADPRNGWTANAFPAFDQTIVYSLMCLLASSEHGQRPNAFSGLLAQVDNSTCRPVGGLPDVATLKVSLNGRSLE